MKKIIVKILMSRESVKTFIREELKFSISEGQALEVDPGGDELTDLIEIEDFDLSHKEFAEARDTVAKEITKIVKEKIEEIDAAIKAAKKAIIKEAIAEI